jgi:hypothetical protein
VTRQQLRGAAILLFVILLWTAWRWWQIRP